MAVLSTLSCTYTVDTIFTYCTALTYSTYTLYMRLYSTCIPHSIHTSKYTLYINHINTMWTHTICYAVMQIKAWNNTSRRLSIWSFIKTLNIIMWVESQDGWWGSALCSLIFCLQCTPWREVSGTRSCGFLIVSEILFPK